MPVVEAQAIRNALSRWSSGVTVITTIDAEGRPKGMTASSFTSVSMTPPLILVCLAKRLYTHELITQSNVFAVNILKADQTEWGKLFAGMMPEVEDRFGYVDGYTTVATGAPILPDVLGWFDCTVSQAIEAGDHTVFIGEISAVGSADEGRPLIYSQRMWGGFAPSE